ncbi:hypothetical protein ACSYDW_07025 [Paeniglutamicibacter sp. R2-26]|uniref:hypothetical protein n=1 Tax=Paeniglutamicibacter sp. R2-26 TaxID=3144417 RepID=UPI003EE4AD33
MGGSGIELAQWLPPALTFLGGIAAVLITGSFTRKTSVVSQAMEARRDTIADREQLIETMQEQLAGALERLTTAESKITQQGEELAKVGDRNNELVTYVYKTAAVMRAEGLTDKMPRPAPHGIHL